MVVWLAGRKGLMLDGGLVSRKERVNGRWRSG